MGINDLRNILLEKYHKARERDTRNKQNGIIFPSLYDSTKDAVKDALHRFNVDNIILLKPSEIEIFYEQIKNL